MNDGLIIGEEGRGVPEILLNCRRMWMGEGRGSDFQGFYVEVINV